MVLLLVVAWLNVCTAKTNLISNFNTKDITAEVFATAKPISPVMATNAIASPKSTQALKTEVEKTIPKFSVSATILPASRTGVSSNTPSLKPDELTTKLPLSIDTRGFWDREEVVFNNRMKLRLGPLPNVGRRDDAPAHWGLILSIPIGKKR